ncbi:MAG: hypothetical protein H8E12_16750 [Rhodobacteraceae bacterium]|nr:hypothetical protein [Paracoccaceae bacterium]
MDNLFIDDNTSEKIAAVTLGEDKTKWTKRIVVSFIEDYPELQNSPMNIVWKQKDLKTGTAVGNLFVGDNINIPLVVSNYMLYPLDLIMLDGRVFPLTREVLEEYFTSPQAFETLSGLSQEPNERLFDTPLRLPTETGKTGYNSATTPVNTLDKVSSFVHDKDYKKMLDEIAKPENYAGFVTNNTAEVLEKLSSISPTNEVDFATALLNNLEMDRQLVREDSFGNRFLKQANSKIDYAYNIDINTDDSFTDKYRNVTLTKTAGTDVTINSYQVGEETLCITKEGKYKLFPSLREVPIKTSNFDIEGSIPQLGDYGTFVVEGTATKPFEVVELQKMAGVGNFEVVGWDGFNKITYFPIKGITEDHTIPHEMLKNAAYIPGNGKFVKLAEKLDIDYYPVSNVTSPSYVGRDSAGLYYLEGAEFDKYAEQHPIRNLNAFDAKWAATHCDACEVDAKKIASLKLGEKYEFTTGLQAPVNVEALQTKIQDEYDRVSRSINILPANLVKEASALSDKNSVDALLSLGLVNRDNVMEFTSLIPEYEGAAAGLAKLLLTARLGLKILDAGALQRGMKSLVTAVYQLKHLRQLLR